MFKFLESYPRVVVVGPVRSGTHIMAQAIAHDLDYRYVDETKFKSMNVARFLALLEQHRVVIQAPRMSEHLGTRWRPTEEVGVVYAYRPPADVRKSWDRVSKIHGWPNGPCPNVEIVQERLQVHFVNSHFYVFPYASLEKHPLWVPKEQRENFTWNQTYVDMSNISET